MGRATQRALFQFEHPMDPAPHILIVDDHRDIRDLLARFLQKHALRTSVASRADEARRVLKSAAIDLIVLDIMMPGEDGFTFARHVRGTTNIPIIFLTALGEDDDRITGLELGADDYVTKPFNPRELLARIKAVLRRAQSMPPSREPHLSERLRFGRWTFHGDRREIVDDDNVATPLSHGEFLLLSVFLQRPNIVLSRDQLLDLTKGRMANLFDRSIDNQVSRLRRKIEDDPKNPQLIQTVWGGGYKFAGRVESV
jgi:two-component system OmpR family response regulator